MPDIHTRRLHLRLPEAADAAQLARLMTASISARLASWAADLDEAGAMTQVERSLAEYRAGRSLPFVICRRENGAVLGWIGTRPGGSARPAVLTYWVGQAHAGQGLMREAAPAALEASFAILGAGQVHAAVQSDNLQSRAVLRSLGMRMMEPGWIWCAARARHEPCEWWGIDRTGQLRQRSRAGAQPLSAPLAALQVAAAG